MNTETIQERTIELSIAKNYVCDWGLWEALREIFQNAIDSDKKGHKLDINYSEDTQSLIIFNENVFLPLNSLVLGNSTKQDDENQIGKYGEGYKLALVVLLRLGYTVHIGVGNDMWVPFFSQSETYETEVLMIKVLKNANKLFTGGTSFVINGILDTTLNNISFKCLPLYKKLHYSIGRTISSSYGDILLEDKFKGKFYVEGLFIQDDTSFTYGYSFKNEHVNLDRDRRAINYYDLLELTTNTLLSQTEDLTIVETSIAYKKKDTQNLDEFFTGVSQEFAAGYANHFLDKHDIDEETFIGTEKEVALSGSTKTFVTDKIQAKIVNQGLNKKEEYERVKELSKQKDNKDVAWQYYHDHHLYKLHQWLKANCNRLSIKQINKFIQITKDIKPYNYNIIQSDVEDMLYLHLKSIKPKYKQYKERTDNNEI